MTYFTYSMTLFEHTFYPYSADQGEGYQWSITLFSRTDILLLGKCLHFYKKKLFCINSNEIQLGNVSQNKRNNV